jgi:hypothetical protein
VLVGVRADGTKELITLAEGYRESAGNWGDLLRAAARRGMRAPVLAVGDGARIAMAFKLIEAAQVRWRAVNAPHLVALVRAGARFERGILVERDDHEASTDGTNRAA